MSFHSVLKLDSGFFSPAKRRAAGGRAVRKTAKSFAKSIQDKMENSPHTGKIVTKSRGENFRIRHQQSRRGQRPSPFTRNLKNSVRSRRINETESIVEVTAEYAERLVKLGRVIVSNQDKNEAQKELDANLLSEISKII